MDLCLSVNSARNSKEEIDGEKNFFFFDIRMNKKAQQNDKARHIFITIFFSLSNR